MSIESALAEAIANSLTRYTHENQFDAHPGLDVLYGNSGILRGFASEGGEA